MSRVVCTISLCNGWQWKVSSATSPPLFRLARQAVCSTMVTNNVCRFIILFISVQTKKGMSEDSTHRKPLLCLVTSFIRAAGDRWMLVTRGTTRSASVFSMGSCPAQPIFSLNRVHELPNYFSQYMIVVTNKNYDKLKFNNLERVYDNFIDNVIF